MNLNKKYARFLFLVLLAGLGVGCNNSRSIATIDIGDKNIYVKRKVWGMNGDDVWLTTNSNPCTNPSPKTDYITEELRHSDNFRFKIENGKLYVYGESFTAPETQFPIEVVAEGYEYNPKNPNYDKVKEEGYKTIQMKIDILCLLDNL